MAKVMVLAESGFGKTSSLGTNKLLGIKGLNPAKTVIIQPTSKGLPFPGSKKLYTPLRVDPSTKKIEGNLIFAKDAETAIKKVLGVMQHMPHIENYIFDDFNFYMQDFYMRESKVAKKNVFTTFEQIGGQTSDFFDIFDTLDNAGKNVVVLAHAEIYEDMEGRSKYKFKTVGSMVDKFITPEGRFETLLLGKSLFDSETKKVDKVFVTADDGIYNAKSPYGMFPELYIKNDMGLVLHLIKKYEMGE